MTQEPAAKWQVIECPPCKGFGWVATDGDKEKPRNCETCNGLGLIKRAELTSGMCGGNDG